MRLPEIELDDRRFSDLVNEARLRVTTACPEWSEHNVSDPGITLIELFAWMTEMTIYRLNRIPDKLHLSLLELLGVRLGAPSAAVADLRFSVARNRAAAVRIPAGTQVATAPLDPEERIVFSVEREHTIPVLQHRVCATQYGGMVHAIESEAAGLELPDDGAMLLFSTPPQTGDALYLGFDTPLDRLTVAVTMDLQPARATVLDPADPPLRWEVSQPHGEWLEAEVIADTTGSLLRPSGTVELQLPPSSAVHTIAGERLHWLRCRVAEAGRADQWTSYEYPPGLRSVATAALEVQLGATHAGRHDGEVLGVSDGTPGQEFSLRHRPVVRTAAGEVLEVQDPESGAWVAWEQRDSFEGSSGSDLRYVLDAAAGTIELGPAVREVDGGWTQYGAVPPKGAALRFTSYRSGGGRRGNVAAGTLTALLDAVDGIASVTNPRPAHGGVDAESLDAARQRAALELHSRHRAVTAEDFELLAAEASPQVGRTVCIPATYGPVVVHVLPRVDPADRRLEYEELVPSEALLAEVGEYLDERRLIGTEVRLMPCRFRGVSVVVSFQALPWSDPFRVELDIAGALYTYLNPLTGGPAGTGWPAGRDLNHGELYGVVHAVAGVEFVKALRTYETDLATGEQQAEPTGPQIGLEQWELIASGLHVVQAARETIER